MNNYYWSIETMIWFRLVMLQNVTWHTLAGSHIKLAL